MSSFGTQCGVCKEPKVDGFCHCDAPERLRRPKSPEEKPCQCCDSELQIAFMAMYPEAEWTKYDLCLNHQADLAAALIRLDA